ncbi:DNA polymerase I [Leptolyngbya sp. CCNP1308]|uniref:DNA polymerase I n=1 Tax=Leptolyngbya sp. CCNP1308 TaxID=3110255 RepID=UPI002B1F8E94|nr:DNA polymerase I [Leptolyngbya sp. CCNP1308]MEA5447488.1 DNA polymerase I [Leptolyngbya sp. CCNP1308]
MAANSSADKPTLMLVDGHSLAFRSYYAFAKNADGGLRTSTGIPTSVCYGFLKSLLDMMEVEKPQYAAVAFDLAAPTFRHQADATYKDGRPEAPEGFLEDVENLNELLTDFGLNIYVAPGFEADDVIGTLATKALAEGFCVKILSGDQDLFQLIDPDECITVLHLGNAFAKGAKNGLAQEFKIEEVKAKLDIYPHQVVDYKALCGDSSDNIPGVKGIGAKTAAKLLAEYGDLDAVYADIDNIKGATQKKLIEGKESAYHSRYMAKIITDIPDGELPIDLATCKLDGFDPDVVIPALKKLEFQNFVNRLGKLQTAFGGAAAEETAAKASQALSGGTSSPEPSRSSRFEDTGGADVAFFTAEETDNAQGVDEVAIAPQIITTEAQLYELLDILSQQKNPATPVSWDTETTSLEPRDATLVGIGCCWGTGREDMAYVPVGHSDGKMLPLEMVLDALRPILESDEFPKALQNAKYDRLVFRHQGIHLRGVVFDTMLASYVLNPEASHNLTDLSLRYLNLVAQSYEDLVPKGKTIADVEIAAVANYCGADVHTTYLLVSKLQAELDEVPDLKTLFAEVELPLEPVLAEMECTGIRVDPDYLANFSKQLETDLARLEKTAYEAAGETFNMGSPKQLSTLFFEKLGLDKRKSRKNKSGGYSTDASTLEKLQGDHAVVDLVVEHRTLSKLKSTYVDALPTLIRPDTHRVHTDFNQAVTATGRLSSSNPNLQNIPIRTAFSRQIRAAFIPETGWRLVAADYSQIELRILAHLSGEPVLVEAYNNNDDVHALTARLLFEKDDITAEERRAGKVINFGIIYGMGAVRFAREAGVSRTEAKTFIDRYYDRYPKVFEYLLQMQREAIAQGYVQTICGRRRYFNFTDGKLRSLRGTDPATIDLDALRTNGYDAGSLRAAANAPIQGSSADIIKIAMIRLHELLKNYQANLLLQVHDELVFEVPPDEWAELEPQIIAVMESAVELKVPLKVEAHAGPNWMEAK